MPSLTIVTRGGEEIIVNATNGQSVMQAIRDSGLDEILALCGGSCSCATCHVYVDDAASMGLPQISSDEDELLETSSYRLPTSRLSCQLELTSAMAGLRVTIAPES